MSEEPKTDQQEKPRWLDPLLWVATACLGVLILSEALGFSEPLLRAAMIVGVCIAGTGIVIVQAKRVCSKCGTRYGYHLRIVNQNTCRQCGNEFPSWPLDTKKD